MSLFWPRNFILDLDTIAVLEIRQLVFFCANRKIMFLSIWIRKKNPCVTTWGPTSNLNAQKRSMPIHINKRLKITGYPKIGYHWFCAISKSRFMKSKPIYMWRILTGSKGTPGIAINVMQILGEGGAKITKLGVEKFTHFCFKRK